MSNTQDSSINWKYLKKGWGLLWLLLYCLASIVIIAIKYFYGIDSLPYCFLLGVVSSAAMFSATFGSDLCGDKPDVSRARARWIAYHFMGLLAIILLPFDRAPGLSAVGVILALLVAYAGQSWMDTKELENDAVNFFKSVWEKSRILLIITFALVIIIGLWSTFSIGAKTHSFFFNTLPTAFQKLNAVRRERLAEEAAKDAAIRAGRKDFSFFQGTSPVSQAAPVASEYLDGPANMTVVMENGTAETYKIQQPESAPDTPAPQEQPVSHSTQMHAEILDAQAPINIGGNRQMSTTAIGWINPSSQGALDVHIDGPSPRSTIQLKNGVWDGNIIQGQWVQEGTSGSFLAKFLSDSSVQFDLYVSNIRVGVIIISNN